MSMAIPPEFDEFVRQEIALGNYRSAEEMIAEGLHLLQERKRRLSELREEIRPALERLDRGEGIMLDDNSLDIFFEEIKTRGRDHLAAKRESQ